MKKANTIILELDRSFEFFLSKDRAQNRITVFLGRNASVKDIIESCGIPHTEIGKIMYNGKEVDFCHIPQQKGLLQVQAIVPPFDVRKASFLRPTPMDSIRFAADANVIRLGKLMLLLGFDTLLCQNGSDSDIAETAKKENRIILTRDTHLLKRKKNIYGRRVRADLPDDQLSETIRFFGLETQIAFCSRCTICNKKLEQRNKEDILHLLEPKTRLYFHRFFGCPGCGKIFWQGSHCDHMRQKFSCLGFLFRD